MSAFSLPPCAGLYKGGWRTEGHGLKEKQRDARCILPTGNIIAVYGAASGGPASLEWGSGLVPAFAKAGEEGPVSVEGPLGFSQQVRHGCSPGWDLRRDTLAGEDTLQGTHLKPG